MVKATNIHKIYEKVHVLNGVNLIVNKGEIISVVGESGAGKTTLLNILGTLIKPSKNFKFNLIINNIDVNSLSDNDLSKFRNKSLGFIFQFHQGEISSNLSPKISTSRVGIFELNCSFSCTIRCINRPIISCIWLPCVYKIN